MKIIGIAEAIKKLKRLSSTDAINKGLDDLANYGVNKAKENLASFTFYNEPQGLSQSIEQQNTAPLERTINADGGYASFVEYGTGVKGKGAPHPDPPKDWVYDVNEHGQAGWWYPTETQPPEGQPQRFDPITGKWYAWTRGMESRPFMFKTSQDIEAIAAQTIGAALQEND